MRDRTLDDFLALYRKKANFYVDKLKEESDCTELIMAWRRGFIEREGIILNSVNYQFHGSGCLFFNEEFELDVDFCLEFPVRIGFNLWKLTSFAESINHALPDRSLEKN